MNEGRVETSLLKVGGNKLGNAYGGGFGSLFIVLDRNVP